jgi:hypothetical protein
MFYYDYKATVSSAYDTNPLKVVGYIKAYIEEEAEADESPKRIYLTEIPFPTFNFSEVPDKTVEGFNNYVKAKVDEVVNSEEWQNKLAELKLAYEIGIYIPVEN